MTTRWLSPLSISCSCVTILSPGLVLWLGTVLQVLHIYSKNYDGTIDYSVMKGQSPSPFQLTHLSKKCIVGSILRSVGAKFSHLCSLLWLFFWVQLSGMWAGYWNLDFLIITFNVSKPPLFPVWLRELERGKKPWLSTFFHWESFQRPFIVDTTSSAAVDVIWAISLLITLGKLTGQAGTLTMLNCYPSCWCRSRNTSWGLSDSWTAVSSYWNTRALVLCWKASSCFEHSTQQHFCVSSTPSQGNVSLWAKIFWWGFKKSS